MEQKKSIQLSQAFGAVLTLVLVAVLVIVAIFIFVTLADTGIGSSNLVVTNETGAFVNATGYKVDGSNGCGITALAITEVNNATNGTVGFPLIGISSANFTFDSSTGIITNATTFNFNSANVSYTFTQGSEACNASESMVTEFSNYTSLIGLVGTIIFLGLVIGVLVTAFAFGGRREV